MREIVSPLNGIISPFRQWLTFSPLSLFAGEQTIYDRFNGTVFDRASATILQRY